jgi:hypothetical protein
LFAFLDVLVTRQDNDTVSTCTYRKSTFSGLYLKFDSFVPSCFKRSLIYGLISRAWRICSSEELFQLDLQYIRHLLAANGYPNRVVNKCVKDFLYKKHKTSSDSPCFGPEKKPVYMCLPYSGNNSTKLVRQLNRIVNRIAPWVKLCITFKPAFRLKSLSKLKSVIPTQNRSNVIYRINCSDCGEFYIGLTTRRLHKRLDEHSKREYCSVYKHASEKNHKMDFINTEVLASDSNKLRLQILETLNINEYSAFKSLNVNIKSYECKLW